MCHFGSKWIFFRPLGEHYCTSLALFRRRFGVVLTGTDFGALLVILLFAVILWVFNVVFRTFYAKLSKVGQDRPKTCAVSWRT